MSASTIQTCACERCGRLCRVAETPSLRRWSKSEADYFFNLNSNEEYMDLEINRVGMLDTVESSRKTALRIIFLSLPAIMVGVLFEDDLVATAERRNQERERILSFAVRGSMGLLLSTDLHTVTHEQNQIFVEIVNRHVPATPRLPPATPRPGRPAKVMARALERLLNDACVEELRRGTGVEVAGGGRRRQHHQGRLRRRHRRPGEARREATKEWFDKDKIGLLCSPGHRPMPPPSFDPPPPLRRDRLVLRGEKAVTSTTTGGDAGAGLGSAGGVRACATRSRRPPPCLSTCSSLAIGSSRGVRRCAASR